jgi:AraC-like DNA-binding protein
MTSPALPESLQRVGFLSCVPELLRTFGVEAGGLLRSVGLKADALDNPEGTIPYRTMGRLLKAAAEKTGCPHFGLELGKQIRTTSLGLLGKLMGNSGTLRAALKNFAFHQHRNAHGGVVYLLEEEHRAFFGYAVYEPDVPGINHIYDCAVMGGFSLIYELAGKRTASSLDVLLSRPEPKDVTHYQEALGSRLCFNSHQTAVVMPLKVLDQPIPKANADVRRTLEDSVRTLWYAGDLNSATQLRRELRVGILEGCVSAPEFATRFGISARTLNRRLSTMGLRFQKVLDETRCLFVQELLTNTQLSINEIGKIVGYTEHSVLTRSFTRWTGMPPSEWRAGRMGEREA